MVSDILSEAAHEIRQALCDFPEAYADTARELHDLLSAMDRLRVRLDTPPAAGEP